MAPTFRIPFSEIPKKPILEKGDYQAMIREVRKEPSSDQQSENLVWDIDIIDPAFEGVSLRMWTNLQLKSLWRLEMVLDQLGLGKEEGKDLDIDIDEETNVVINPQLSGKPCVVAVSKGKDQSGKRDQNNVEDLFGPSGRPAKVSSQSNGSAQGARRPRAR